VKCLDHSNAIKAFIPKIKFKKKIFLNDLRHAAPYY
jgi:hypothetical protein